MGGNPPINTFGEIAVDYINHMSGVDIKQEKAAVFLSTHVYSNVSPTFSDRSSDYPAGVCRKVSLNLAADKCIRDIMKDRHQLYQIC